MSPMFPQLLFKLKNRDRNCRMTDYQENNQGKDDTRNVAKVPVADAFDVWDLDASMLKLYCLLLVLPKSHQWAL
jgi:hypothetical protein